MLVHVLHLWTLCQKNAPQIFERLSSYKNIEQNVKDSSFWASCIAGIVNKALIAYNCLTVGNECADRQIASHVHVGCEYSARD